MMPLDNAITISKEICRARYPDAVAAFVAGSIVRGEGTPFSDLDLVIVFPELPHGYRESFYVGDRPVEAFIHDPETLHYFMAEADPKAGLCIMAQMVAEGIPLLPPCAVAKTLKQIASSVVASAAPQRGRVAPAPLQHHQPHR